MNRTRSRKAAMLSVLAGVGWLLSAVPAKADAPVVRTGAHGRAEGPPVIDGIAKSRIRRAEVVRKDGRLVLRGRVDPANRSHIPRRLQRHIEVWAVPDDDHGAARLVEVLPLRARQQFFAVRLDGTLLTPEDHLHLRYARGVDGHARAEG